MSMIYRMLMMHHRTKTILTPSLTQDRSWSRPTRNESNHKRQRHS
jgi:hypothetical protein